MWTQIPRFRLPETVIDEETGYILNMGVHFKSGQRIDSMKALLDQGYDAIFVGCGAPRGRNLEIPGRYEAAANIHIGIDWLASVSFGHTTKIGKRVIVLGGGNTAMDCCRSSRRLGGDDVKVIVRSGFEEMKASPWEKEDAMHEGIPIINYHVPKAFVHDNGKLTGMTFEIVKAVYDEKGNRSLVPTGEPDAFFECDDVLVAVGQENAFPWIEKDCGVVFDKWGLPALFKDTYQSTVPNVFFGGDAAYGPKNIIWAVAHGHGAAVSIDRFLHGEDVSVRPPPMVNLMSQKMGIHEWSYDNDKRLALQSAVGQSRQGAGQHQDRGRVGVRCRDGLEGGAAVPQLRRADRLHRQCLHRMRCLRGHLPDGLHHLHRERRGGGPAHAPEGPGTEPCARPVRVG
jgi:formate dehydrogenase (NADP+) beta subunit